MMDLLPIGSVVKLKARELSHIAIIGFQPVADEKKYDYCGVVLPFGLLKGSGVILFNQNQIDAVEHKGYENEKAKMLKEIMQQING